MKKKNSSSAKDELKVLKEKYQKSKSVTEPQKSTGNGDKFFKFQNMSKLIVNKIDDILGSNSQNILNNDFFVDSTKDIISQLETNLKQTEIEPYFDTPLVSEKRNPQRKQSEKSTILKPVVSKKPTEKPSQIEKSSSNTDLPTKPQSRTESIKTAPKNTFMTDVEIIANQRASEDYQKYHDNKIKEVLSTLDDLDDEFTGDSELEDDFKKDVCDIKKLFNELDSLKKDKQDEFDELQYLIKLVNNTQDSVDRHIKGVNSIYKIQVDKNNEDSDYMTDNANDEVFYPREKNISKIKNNIFNIQDNVFSFYDNMKKNMKIK
jgi:hypothetical protein